jgi:Na+/proline symporter
MQIALPQKSDNLYPMLAMGGYLGNIVGVIFILGLIAAAYSSADSALTALTTSFCIDILSIEKKYTDEQQIKIRKIVHIAASALMFLCILIFHALSNESVIKELFTIAGYTYGPLLGLYAFGLLTKVSVKDKWVPLICILSPLFCYILSRNSEAWLGGYKFGFELLILNGIFTFLGLLIVKNNKL